MRPSHLPATALALALAMGAAACSNDQVPSSFDDAGSQGGRDGAGSPSDGSSQTDSPNLVGDAAPGSFQCGQTICHGGNYCVLMLNDAGVTQSSACYPLQQCNDCPCVTNVAAVSACAGDTLGCAGAPGSHLYVTCEPGQAPRDAGGG